MFKQATCSKFAFLFLTGLVSLIIAACGGGGGGGGEPPTGTNYTGKTTQAVITDENAKDLLLGAYNFGQVGGTPVMGLSLEPTTVLGPSRFQAAADSLMAFMARIELTGPGHYSAARQVSPDTVTIHGNCGEGYALVTPIPTDEPGAFSASATYFNYCEDGITLSGEATITGQAQESELFYKMKFTNLSYRSANDAFTMTGDISFYFSDPSNLPTVTMNVNLRDSQNQVYRVVNLEHKFTREDYEYLTATGTYYDPIHGFVLLDTPVRLKYLSSNHGPIAGTLRASGANQTWATMTFDGNSNYEIETGSGT